MALNPNGHENLAWVRSLTATLLTIFVDSLRGEGLDEIERGESSLVLGESEVRKAFDYLELWADYAVAHDPHRGSPGLQIASRVGSSPWAIERHYRC